jgi:glucose/arabinose dehydrogenase
VTGALWNNENGPNGGDEINVILPGRNYGWPS